MEFIKIVYNKISYNYDDANSIRMATLGLFLTSDVGYRPSSFKAWAFDNDSKKSYSNITSFEKVDGYILLTDMYSEEKEPTILKMYHEQFVQILTD